MAKIIQLHALLFNRTNIKSNKDGKNNFLLEGVSEMSNENERKQNEPKHKNKHFGHL